MAPTLPVGALPRVTQAPLRPGDVAVFRRRRSGELVTHRLIARVWLPARLGGARWIESGDAHPTRAGVIRESQLVGRVETPSHLPGPLARLRLTAFALVRALGARMV
jgi:hypothetical protein